MYGGCKLAETWWRQRASVHMLEGSRGQTGTGLCRSSLGSSCVSLPPPFSTLPYGQLHKTSTLERESCETDVLRNR